MAVGDILNARLAFSHPNASGQMVNLLDYQFTTESTSLSESEECTELAEALGAEIETYYLPRISDAFTFVGVYVYNRTQPIYFGTYNSSTPGDSVNEPLALRSAVIVQKHTSLRGRSHRGRIFLMAPTEADQAGGVLTAGALSAYQTAIDNIRLVSVAATGNGYAMQVVHTNIDESITAYPVTSLVVNPNLGTIKGRQKTTT